MAAITSRERATGTDHAERLAHLAERKAETERRLADLKQRWERERDLVGKVRAARERLEGTADPGSKGNGKEEEHLRAELDYWRELELLSGQREHFKPGRTDESANADDEVAA